MRILLVDNGSEDLRLLAERLRDDGHAVLTAGDPDPGGGCDVVLSSGPLIEMHGACQGSRAGWKRCEALTASPVGIFRTDGNGRCLYVNSRWCEITGMTAEAAVGRRWCRAVCPEDRDRVRHAWQRAADRGAMFRCEYRCGRPDGTTRWVAGQAVAEKDAAGRTVGFVGTINDISDRKRIEKELDEERRDLTRTVDSWTRDLRASLAEIERANRRLREVNQQRKRFLSHVSHEIRTPLNALLGFADLLHQPCFGTLTDRQRGFVRQIETGGRHLLALINDLLDIAKVDAGAVELVPETLKPGEVVSPALEMMQSDLDRKGLGLELWIDPEAPRLRADRRRCGQILLNLLSNAVKYTPEGGRIEVRVEAAGDERVRVSVRDTGVGIEPGEQEAIFSEFHQSDSDVDRAGGAGLGLALTRRLVELHGGRIGVDSRPGEGSTFWFTLPAEEAGREQCEKDPRHA